ncbi:hypothetical protein MTR67_003207 [Solanum verrucosum]|uniref:Uncharacterized protein n=1 Tax=Solanum verrucosum TaxID=315347 RepID=A0AAF0PS27_SOLVR|nr:hypothetical protein MTR67_003207 [Solanum verrucosum]
MRVRLGSSNGSRVLATSRV